MKGVVGLKRLVLLFLAVMLFSAGCGNRASSQDISPVPVSSDYEQGYEDGVEEGRTQWENEAIEDYEENGIDYDSICSGAIEDTYSEAYDQGYVDGYLDAVNGNEPIFDIDY